MPAFIDLSVRLVRMGLPQSGKEFKTGRVRYIRCTTRVGTGLLQFLCNTYPLLSLLRVAIHISGNSSDLYSAGATFES